MGWAWCFLGVKSTSRTKRAASWNSIASACPASTGKRKVRPPGPPRQREGTADTESRPRDPRREDLRAHLSANAFWLPAELWPPAGGEGCAARPHPATGAAPVQGEPQHCSQRRFLVPCPSHNQHPHGPGPSPWALVCGTPFLDQDSARKSARRPPQGHREGAPGRPASQRAQGGFWNPALLLELPWREAPFCGAAWLQWPSWCPLSDQPLALSRLAAPAWGNAQKWGQERQVRHWPRTLPFGGCRDAKSTPVGPRGRARGGGEPSALIGWRCRSERPTAAPLAGVPSPSPPRGPECAARSSDKPAREQPGSQSASRFIQVRLHRVNFPKRQPKCAYSPQ